MPLAFSKENFSNGCIATVDVFYPQLPQFLLLSPALAKAAVVPLLDYASSDRWKFDFAPHDLGTYPQANGQVYGGGERTEENQMPVEECGNMLILMAAIAKVDGNADFAGKYWPVLTKWAKYLEAKGFDPENQLCTDDFAGHLAHNTNLSVKAIMGLGVLRDALPRCAATPTKPRAYRKIAEEFAARWVKEADDGDHYRLTFDKPGTWSQKYNLVWDKLLGLNLFPKDVAQKEIAYYLTKQNKYGLPLDSRKHVHEARLDRLDGDARRAAARTSRRSIDADPRVPARVAVARADDRLVLHRQRQAGRLPGPAGRRRRVHQDARRRGDVEEVGRPRRRRSSGDWAPMPVPPTVEVVEPGSKPDGVVWRYTTDKPADGWMKPDFDDSGWKQGPGGFGTERHARRDRADASGTRRDIYVRREITVPDGADLDVAPALRPPRRGRGDLPQRRPRRQDVAASPPTTT